MFINKMGSEHFNYGINNQDSGFIVRDDILCVVDGCSEGLNSEVGAKLFAKKFMEKIKEKYAQNVAVPLQEIIDEFDEIMHFIIGKNPSESSFLDDMRNYMCFTIVFAQKIGNEWYVYTFGDGYIITQDYNDNIEFINVNHSQIPNYLAYAFIDDANVKRENGDEKLYNIQTFDIDKFKAIGIASDGISYIIGSDYENEFKELLKERQEFKIKRLINKLNVQFEKRGGFFKDDTTIAIF